MVKPLLEQLRAKVENARGLPDTTKAELLRLVGELDKQTAADAATISDEGKPGVNKLMSTVEGLEASHPDITELVNRISTMLANIGI